MHTTPELHTDPVCGMQVDGTTARERDLVHEHEGETYYFCGRGCLLDFRDEPERFLASGYEPRMM